VLVFEGKMTTGAIPDCELKMFERTDHPLFATMPKEIVFFADALAFLKAQQEGAALAS
jgi:hypothetical protein